MSGTDGRYSGRRRAAQRRWPTFGAPCPPPSGIRTLRTGPRIGLVHHVDVGSAPAHPARRASGAGPNHADLVPLLVRHRGALNRAALARGAAPPERAGLAAPGTAARGHGLPGGQLHRVPAGPGPNQRAQRAGPDPGRAAAAGPGRNLRVPRALRAAPMAGAGRPAAGHGRLLRRPAAHAGRGDRPLRVGRRVDRRRLGHLGRLRTGAEAAPALAPLPGHHALHLRRGCADLRGGRGAAEACVPEHERLAAAGVLLGQHPAGLRHLRRGAGALGSVAGVRGHRAHAPGHAGLHGRSREPLAAARGRARGDAGSAWSHRPWW